MIGIIYITSSLASRGFAPRGNLKIKELSTSGAVTN